MQSLNPAIFDILRSKCVGVTRFLPFKVTRRYRSCDHLIPHMSFPIDGPLEQSLHLQPFSSYCALSVLGSRV